MRTIVKTLLAGLLIIGISNPAQAQKKRKSNPHEAGEDIYKHYRGTIGNRAVVFDVIWGWQGGSNYGGSYFYYPDRPGMKHFYISEPKTYDHDEILYCTVVPENTKPGSVYDRNQPMENMEFTITGTHLRGKWHSAYKKEMYFINAIEDYDYAVPLEIKFYTDDNRKLISSKGKQFRVEYNFIGTLPRGSSRVTAFYNYKGTQPLGSDRITTFINDVATEFLGSTGGYTVDGCLQSGAEKYFDELSEQRNTIPESFAFSDDNRNVYIKKTVWLMPVYNENDILVLKKEIDDIGHNGLQKERCSYICLDIANGKQITLGDIITIDKNKLSVLLETAFRNRNSIPPAKKLNTILKVSKIPFIANAAIVNGGLIFSYDYYSLFAKRNDDFMKSEVNIFIPYTDLKDLLKPEFKKRIGM